MFRKYSWTFDGVVFTSGPFLDSDYVHESLIRRHLFPSIKQDFDEIPPVFSSDSLSLDLSNEVFDRLKNATRGSKKPWEQRSDSFSPMRYTFLKFNGNVRTIQVPHPVPYMRLAHELAENWDAIETKLVSKSSRIRPKVHPDGRIMTMEYGDKAKQAIEEATRLVGTRFIVRTDISNCFPSLYTHAIDWALRSKEVAKKDKSTANWEARIDMRVRDLQDGETNGVGIGPGTSSLVAETVLQVIDKQLEDRNYSFTRHIDDYECYTASRQEAERFVIDLNDCLYEYRLTLNHRKTEIVDVEAGNLESWLHEVKQVEPEPDDSALTLIRKLRGLQGLSRRYPDSSVLIYGIKALASVAVNIEKEKLDRIVPELARMIWVAPSLTPKVVNMILPLLDLEREGSGVLMNSLEKVLASASERKQADVVMWSIYGMSLLSRGLRKEFDFKEVQWNPVCMALGLSLYRDELANDLIAAGRSIAKEERSSVEEMWLLRYQLWLEGMLDDTDLNSDCESPYFSLLRDHNVDFFQVPKSYEDPSTESA